MWIAPCITSNRGFTSLPIRKFDAEIQLRLEVAPYDSFNVGLALILDGVAGSGERQNLRTVEIDDHASPLLRIMGVG